jgi:peptide deformylase
MGDECMSDILTIDTSAGIIKDQKVEPLPLYDENHPMLLEPIPEYKQRLPNGMMSNLIKRMKLTMQQYGGIGLSANQCGVFERVFVIGTGEFQLACINPKIISQSDKAIKADEGCLSFPGFYVKVPRPEEITVEFTDEDGNIKEAELTGLTARCFMHELDHMNGIRLIDHAGPVAIQQARRKQEKILKKAIRRK